MAKVEWSYTLTFIEFAQIFGWVKDEKCFAFFYVMNFQY